MTSGILPALQGSTVSTSRQAVAGSKTTTAAPRGLNPMESVLAGIAGESIAAPGTAAGAVDLFSLGARPATSVFDLAGLLTGTGSDDESASPDLRVAEARDQMIGTLLDLKK